MKTYLTIFLCLLSATAYAGPDNLPSTPPESERLTQEEAAAFDALPEASGFDEDNVILPNGEKAGDFLKAHDSDFYNRWGRDATRLKQPVPENTSAAAPAAVK